MLRLSIFLACAILATADQYPACDNVGSGTLNNVVIPACSPTTRCSVNKGSTINFEVEFTPSANTNTLTVNMYGILPGLPLPLPFVGFDSVGCNPSYNIHCPLTGGTTYKYNNTINVPTAVITPLNVQAKTQFKDDGGNTIVCFLLNMRIER